MSSHLRVLERRNLVLGIVAVALALILIFRADTETSVDKGSLPLLFPHFEADSARRIEIEKIGGAGSKVQVVRLQRTGDGNKWVLASHENYPTKAGAQALLDAISSARLRSEVTHRRETFGKYADADAWTRVAVIDTQGKNMVEFFLGRSSYPDTFVRIGKDTDQRIVKASNIRPSDARAEARSWIETRIWPELTATNMLRLDVKQHGDAALLTVAKRGAAKEDVGVEVPAKGKGDDDLYWVASPYQAAAKKLAVEDLAREFTSILIQDIVGGSDADPAKFGLDDPEIVATFWSKPGKKVEKHTLRVGKKSDDGKAWYVQREGAPWIFTVSTTSISRMRQLPDEYRQPPEKPAKGADGKGEEPKKGEPAKGDASKKGEPAKDDGSKGDTSKKDEPKKDEPKKDEPVKDGSGKDAPGKDAPGKDAPGKDAPGKGDASKGDTPRKDAPKKDGG